MSVSEQAAGNHSVAQSAEQVLRGIQREKGPLAVSIVAVGQVQEQSREPCIEGLTPDHQDLADSMRENPLFSSGVRTDSPLHPTSLYWTSRGLHAPMAGARHEIVLLLTALFNPPFSVEVHCAGHVELSDEDSDTESEEHHRTIRGREAQQIVKRLKGTYRGRSRTAPDILYSAAQGECYDTSASPGLLL